MGYNVLLYGATGYSGKLIAAEGKAWGMSKEGGSNFQMILAARNGAELQEVAEKNCMVYRVFGLDNFLEVCKHLDGIDVVINAAGPFAFTAERLAKAALTTRVHYVDINGEVNVYRKLDDFGLRAKQRGVAVVSAAGSTAAASEILLDGALKRLLSTRRVDRKEGLGTIRIGLTRVASLSRGSVQTAAQLLREQVIVIRRGQIKDHRGERINKLVVWHEPVGKLEHTFRFHDRDREEGHCGRVASAANLIDTLTAWATVERHGLPVHAIESYVETGAVGRIAYQLGATFASLGTLPWARALMQAQLSILPEGPEVRELEQERHSVVLEIDDPFRARLVDWRWETPNVYQFTAQLAVAVAHSVAIAARARAGWITPAAVLDGALDRKDTSSRTALRGCKLQGAGP